MKNNVAKIRKDIDYFKLTLMMIKSYVEKRISLNNLTTTFGSYPNQSDTIDEDWTGIFRSHCIHLECIQATFWEDGLDLPDERNEILINEIIDDFQKRVIDQLSQVKILLTECLESEMTYSPYVEEQMKHNGIVLSDITNALENGIATLGKKPGTTAVYDESNHITVIINLTDSEVSSVYYGTPLEGD